MPAAQKAQKAGQLHMSTARIAGGGGLLLSQSAAVTVRSITGPLLWRCFQQARFARNLGRDGERTTDSRS